MEYQRKLCTTCQPLIKRNHGKTGVSSAPVVMPSVEVSTHGSDLGMCWDQIFKVESSLA